MATWKIYARQNFTRVAPVVVFNEFSYVDRHNDPGTWTLTLPVDTLAAGYLNRPTVGVGIIVTRDDAVVFSGRVDNVRDDGDRLEVSGTSDSIALAECVGRPIPAGQPYTVEYRTLTGVAETVMRTLLEENGGPTAPDPSKRIPGLADVIGEDTGLGTEVTARVRLNALLTLFQEYALAGGGLRFWLEQTTLDFGGIRFRVAAPTDLSASVVFSRARGTMQSRTIERSGATATYVYGLGPGERENQVIVEDQNPDAMVKYGRRELVLDQRGDQSLSEALQATTEALVDADEAISISFVALDVPGQTYLDDYALGDLVAAETDDGAVETGVIRAVEVTIGEDGEPRIVPTIGTASTSVDDATIRQIRAVQRRLSNIELNTRTADDSISMAMLTPEVRAALATATPPIGEIRWLAGPTVPDGYLSANGQSVLRADYPALFAELGTTWGAADGTHFNVPNLQGRFPIGANGSTFLLGATGGAATVDASHTHTSQAHTHPGSHSHGAGGIVIAHVHLSQAHDHPGSHSHGHAHTHTVNIDHNHAAFSSGLTNNDSVAVGHASLGSGASDHHHQIDVPALGTTNVTSGPASAGSTDADSNVFAANYSGSPSGASSVVNSGSTDADSNVFAASYTGSPSAASPSLAALSVLNPYAVLNPCIYSGV